MQSSDRNLSAVDFDFRNMSPDEEFSARIRMSATPEKLSDDVIALLMQKQEFKRVLGNEIVIEIGTVRRVYTHVDSMTCQSANEGKRFLISYSIDFPEAIYVLTDDGAYQETIPLKTIVKWFDREATSKAVHDSETRLDRAKESLDQLQARHSTLEQKRKTGNAHSATAALRQMAAKIIDDIDHGRAPRLPKQPVAESPTQTVNIFKPSAQQSPVNSEPAASPADKTTLRGRDVRLTPAATLDGGRNFPTGADEVPSRLGDLAEDQTSLNQSPTGPGNSLPGRSTFPNGAARLIKAHRAAQDTVARHEAGQKRRGLTAARIALAEPKTAGKKPAPKRLKAGRAGIAFMVASQQSDDSNQGGENDNSRHTAGTDD